MAANLNQQYTLMLIDDHELTRLGLITVLNREKSLSLIGEYSHSRDFLLGIGEKKPDIALVDFSLSPLDVDGLHLIRKIKSLSPHTRVLIVSSHYNPVTIKLAFEAGCGGFVGKNQDINDVISAIFILLKGGSYLHPEMQQTLNELAPTSADVKNQALAVKTLTPREHEVLRCLLDGMTVNEIAQKFFRSANTISTQKKAAFNKLGIRKDGELFRLQPLLHPR